MNACTHIICSIFLCLFAVTLAVSDDSRSAAPAKATQYLRADSAFFPLKSWESSGKADGKFYNITDVEFHPNGNIYTSHPGLDIYARVQIFDTNGKFLDWFGGFGEGKKSEQDMKGATGLALCPNGNVYVGESLGNTVQQYTGDGKYIQTWSLPGRLMSCPICVAVDCDGNVYTADSFNSYLYKHTNKGTLLWEKALNSSGFRSSRPEDIAISPDGKRVYLADSAYHGIRVFSGESGKELKAITGADSMIDSPWTLECRSDGRLIVLDVRKDEVFIQLLSSDGVRLSVTKFTRKQGSYFYQLGVGPDGVIAVAVCNIDTEHGKLTLYRNAIYKPTDGTAKIKGKVKGLSGDAMANLTVRIDGTQDGVPFYASARPNSKGKFVFTRFPDGVDYIVTPLGYDTTKYNCEPVNGTASGKVKIKLHVKK